MTYGNKFILVVFFLSFFLITGCVNRNWYYDLYDDYKIQTSNDKIILTKNNQKINLMDNLSKQNFIMVTTLITIFSNIVPRNC